MSKKERKAATVSVSFLDKINTEGTKFFMGKLPEKDVKKLNRVIEMLREKQTKNLKDYADNYVKSRRRYVDPNELREDIYSEYGIEKKKKKKISDTDLMNMSDDQLLDLERQLGIK